MCRAEYQRRKTRRDADAVRQLVAKGARAAAYSVTAPVIMKTISAMPFQVPMSPGFDIKIGPCRISNHRP